MNLGIFSTNRNKPRADATNEAGGAAYALAPKAALAQLAATGTFGNTYYAAGEDQLAAMLDLLPKVEPEFVAKLAIYARARGGMKDAPAMLLAWLFARGESALVARAFSRVIDNGRMMRNFVQSIRSGRLGRKSLGSTGKRLVRDWIANRNAEAVWKDSIGNSPSIRDVLRMVHPRPRTDAERALYGYLVGRAHDPSLLPGAIREYEAFVAAVKAGGELAELAVVPPGADFRWLTALPLRPTHWRQIALAMPHMALRMNLNTLARHGVFSDAEVTASIAAKLAAGARHGHQMPHQYLSAIGALSDDVPASVKAALGVGLDMSLANVPPFGTRTLVFVDVSGSMDSPVTGHRRGGTSKVMVVDVAALFAAAALKANPDAGVYWFHTEAGHLPLNPRDSVETLAGTIKALPRGGTDASAPLALALQRKERAGLVIWLSDEQSWAAAPVKGATATATLWDKYRKGIPGAKAIHINLQPGATVQQPGATDVLNVGGFSDAVWDVIRGFVSGSPAGFVGEVESVTL